MDVALALGARRSVRAFLPDPIPDATVEHIFGEAQKSPSWCNIQPWRAWVASGPKRDELVRELVKAAETTMPAPHVPFPTDYPEPYGTHRRQCGKALYEAMGVARDDGDGRRSAWMRNFVAFDAPVVAIVGIDQRFGIYAALDVGCWLESVMLLAVEAGLSTCAQASLALYPEVHQRILGVPDGVQLLFGIALGKEDTRAAANACRTSRDPLEKNVVFAR
jgi:nitroreductase